MEGNRRVTIRQRSIKINSSRDEGSSLRHTRPGFYPDRLKALQRFGASFFITTVG